MSKGWVIGLLVLLAVLLSCCCLAVAVLAMTRVDWGEVLPGDWGYTRITETTTRELRVDAPASLSVKNRVGAITVRPGSDGYVRVTATMEARARGMSAARNLLDGVRLTTSSTGDRATVEVTLARFSGPESLKVDLDIYVPVRTNLQIHNDVGEVRVTGVEGTMLVSSSVGRVDLRDVLLTGDSQLEAKVGEVRFRGDLPSRGQVVISTDVGDLEVSLPRGSQFLLDASTKVGKIECDFSLEDREEGRDLGPAGELRGRVGVDPQVTLRLRTGTGKIALEQR